MSGFKEMIRKGGLDGWTIVDSPPGFSKEIYHIMDACDDIIVVTNPDVPAITDALKVIEIAKNMKKNTLSVVITRLEKKPSEILSSEIEALCEVTVIGTIPEDQRMKRAIFEKTPLVFHSPNAKAAIHYRHLAAKLANVDYEPPSMLALKRLFGMY